MCVRAHVRMHVHTYVYYVDVPTCVCVCVFQLYAVAISVLEESSKVPKSNAEEREWEYVERGESRLHPLPLCVC